MPAILPTKQEDRAGLSSVAALPGPLRHTLIKCTATAQLRCMGECSSLGQTADPLSRTFICKLQTESALHLNTQTHQIVLTVGLS